MGKEGKGLTSMVVETSKQTGEVKTRGSVSTTMSQGCHLVGAAENAKGVPAGLIPRRCLKEKSKQTRPRCSPSQVVFTHSNDKGKKGKGKRKTKPKASQCPGPGSTCFLLLICALNPTPLAIFGPPSALFSSLPPYYHTEEFHA